MADSLKWRVEEKPRPSTLSSKNINPPTKKPMAELILCIDHFAFFGNKMWDVIFFFKKRKMIAKKKYRQRFRGQTNKQKNTHRTE